jgi:NAD(P)-dependent dehydrogenase (short-subunit alcohol dehydrogenase family)
LVTDIEEQPRGFLFVGGGVNNRLAQCAFDRGVAALTVSRVRPNGVRVAHLLAGLDTPAEWVAAIDAGYRQLGRLDVLVTCTGMAATRVDLAARDDEDWCVALRDDALTTLRSALHAMNVIRRPGGVIVNLTGVRATPDDASCAPALAAFAAVETTTHLLALDVRPSHSRMPPDEPTQSTHSTRYPLFALDESIETVNRILALIDDDSAHDATYRL